MCISVVAVIEKTTNTATAVLHQLKLHKLKAMYNRICIIESYYELKSCPSEIAM